LGLVLLFPRLNPAHLANEGVPAFVATGEVLLLPCPVDASIKLHAILFAVALFRLVVEANRIASALVNFGLVRQRGAIAVSRTLPLSK
jgi:hypothetical protein